MPGGRSRHRAAVDRVEVASGRQHVGAAAGRRAGRPGLDEPAIERLQDSADLGPATLGHRGAKGFPDLVQDRTGRLPGGIRPQNAGDQGAGQKLQALDRVTAAAPGLAARSLQDRRPEALPGGGHGAIERIEAGKLQIRSQRAQERGIAARSCAARHARKGHQQVGQPVAFGRLAELVQAIPDLQLLELAEVVVELGKGGVRAIARFDADVAVEPEAPAQGQDLAPQVSGAARVDPGRVVVLVDQPLELGKRPVGFRARERRRQMVDDHRGTPPLGLAALARVVDDEGVDVGQRPERRLREAAGRERQRLAREPFEIAMLAHMDHGMDAEALAQPGVEGEIAVRRRQIRIVIARGRVDVIAARRLDADHEVTERQHGEREGAVHDMRVSGRFSPLFFDFFSNFFSELLEEPEVISNWQGEPGSGAGRGLPAGW